MKQASNSNSAAEQNTESTQTAWQQYDVIIIGSGFAGLCAAIKLKEQGVENFVILEREAELGGTWWRNDYPGAAVDVVSSLYSYSFAPYPWTRRFAKQPEILAYTRHVIAKYGLGAHGRTHADVSHVAYDNDSQQWQVTCANNEINEANYRAPIVINAIGHLSQPSIPALKGLDDFKGGCFHTARWDHTVDYHGKRVGVIGTGASAIQVVPAIAEATEQLHVFQRTAHWIVPRHDHVLGAAARWIQKRPLLQRIKRALQLPNVSLQTQGIERITEHGVALKNGTHVDLDILVFATGFHAFTSNKCLPFDVIGPKGQSLREQWAAHAQAYVGVSVPEYPNFFHLNGPNTGIGHTSAIFMTESQVAYITSAIAYMKKRGAKQVAIKPAVAAAYNQKLKRAFSRSVWQTGGCSSWYQSEAGENTTIFPTFTFLFNRWTRRFRPQEHDIQ